AQFTVIQEPTITASLGGNVILSCGRSDGSVAGSNQPCWVYQSPGSVPKGLTGSDNVKPPGTSERFTGSIQGSSGVLSISNVQAADDGDYYCALWTGSACTVLQIHTQRDTNINFPFCSSYILV
ncbi:unnamed protein product, partial [Staurois parvus]